jgi:hypothetical protein
MKKETSNEKEKRAPLCNFLAERNKVKSSSKKLKAMLDAFGHTFRSKQGS